MEVLIFEALGSNTSRSVLILLGAQFFLSHLSLNNVLLEIWISTNFRGGYHKNTIRPLLNMNYLFTTHLAWQWENIAFRPPLYLPCFLLFLPVILHLLCQPQQCRTSMAKEICCLLLEQPKVFLFITNTEIKSRILRPKLSTALGRIFLISSLLLHITTDDTTSDFTGFMQGKFNSVMKTKIYFLSKR